MNTINSDNKEKSLSESIQPKVTDEWQIDKENTPEAASLLFRYGYAVKQSTENPNVWNCVCPMCKELKLEVYSDRPCWQCLNCSDGGFTSKNLEEVILKEQNKTQQNQPKPEEKSSQEKKVIEDQKQLSNFMKQINSAEGMDEKTFRWWMNRY